MTSFIWPGIIKAMKNLVLLCLFGLLSAFLTGCSNFRVEKKQSADLAKEVDRPAETVKEKPILKGPTAIWYLLTHERVTLYLKNVDNASAASMILEKGANQLPIAPGHWELTGFEEGDNSFTSMNTSKKFVFRVTPKSMTYAGSIVIGCPNVPTVDFKYLKPMKFFNRYPFSSEVGLCEMIIGDDFATVRADMRKTQKTKGLKLTIGF